MITNKSMKKFVIPIAAAIVLGFVSSCSDDECDHSVIQPDSSSLLDVAGNWYEEATNEEMRYNENGTFYDRYCNTTRSGETEGRWEYDQANRRLTWTYSFMGQTQFSDWTGDRRQIFNLPRIILLIPFRHTQVKMNAWLAWTIKG